MTKKTLHIKKNVKDDVRNAIKMYKAWKFSVSKKKNWKKKICLFSDQVAAILAVSTLVSFAALF